MSGKTSKLTGKSKAWVSSVFPVKGFGDFGSVLHSFPIEMVQALHSFSKEMAQAQEPMQIDVP